jgi:hypothetical protein
MMDNLMSIKVIKEDQFGELYPASIRFQMLGVTRGKRDFLFLDFLINNAFLQKTDRPRVNLYDFCGRYEIPRAEIWNQINKLIDNKVISIIGARHNERGVRFFVPLVSSEIKKLAALSILNESRSA